MQKTKRHHKNRESGMKDKPSSTESPSKRALSSITDNINTFDMLNASDVLDAIDN